jgi:hypothetical protein
VVPFFSHKATFPIITKHFQYNMNQTPLSTYVSTLFSDLGTTTSSKHIAIVFRVALTLAILIITLFTVVVLEVSLLILFISIPVPIIQIYTTMGVIIAITMMVLAIVLFLFGIAVFVPLLRRIFELWRDSPSSRESQQLIHSSSNDVNRPDEIVL